MSNFPLDQEPGKHGRHKHVCVHACVVLNGIQLITGSLLEARVEHFREYIWLKPDIVKNLQGRRRDSCHWNGEETTF